MKKIHFLLSSLLALLLIVLILIFIIKPLYEAPFQALDLPATPAPGRPLAEEKIYQETLSLKIDNIKQTRFWQVLPDYFGFITLFTAILSALIGVLQYLDGRQKEREERRSAHEKEHRQRQQALEERRAAFRLRIENKLEKIEKQLASSHPAIRAGGAVSIISLVSPAYREFLEPVYFILLTSLKLAGISERAAPQEVVTTRYLIKAFEKALRWKLAEGLNKDRALWLNLAHCYLERIDLSGLDLSEADIAFSHLKGANLTNTNLFRARGYEASLQDARLSGARLEEARLQCAKAAGADFTGSRLISCDLKHSVLTNARFQQASLQGSHLDGANLHGAHFEQADLNDAYFRQARLDKTTMRSLIKARNWQDKTFRFKGKSFRFEKYDRPVYLELLELEKSGPAVSRRPHEDDGSPKAP